MIYNKTNSKEIILHSKNPVGGMLQMMLIYCSHYTKIFLLFPRWFVVYSSPAYTQQFTLLTFAKKLLL